MSVGQRTHGINYHLFHIETNERKKVSSRDHKNSSKMDHRAYLQERFENIASWNRRLNISTTER